MSGTARRAQAAGPGPRMEAHAARARAAGWDDVASRAAPAAGRQGPRPGRRFRMDGRHAGRAAGARAGQGGGERAA
jgi:hypothetical protein